MRNFFLGSACFSLYMLASHMELEDMSSKNWQIAEQVTQQAAIERLKRDEIERLEQALVDAPDHEKPHLMRKLRELIQG